MKKIVALVLCLALALALCTVAFATEEAPYYTKTTNEAQTTATNIEMTFHKAVEPKTDKTTGVQTAGNVAYYTLSGAANEGKYFVAVNTLAEASLVVYNDAAFKNVVRYLNEVADPHFFDVKVYTNFGDKCGQFDYAGYDKDVTYYTVNGKLFAASKTGDQFLRVDGKLVTAAYKTDIAPETHVSVPVLKDATVVGYECANCKLAAVEAPNYDSIPAGAARDTLAGNWYWPAAAAAKTPASGVTSAKTFDAGVAMYAGLALMSVAGSAVVIGKKKEF